MKILLSCLFLLAISTFFGSAYAQTESVGMRNWFLISAPSNERANNVVRNDVRRGWLCADARNGLLSTCPVDFELLESTLPVSVPGVNSQCVLDASLRVLSGTCPDGGHRHEDPIGTLLTGDARERPVLFRVLDTNKNTADNPPFEDVRYPQDTDTEPRTVTGGFTGVGIIDPSNAFTWTVPHVGGIYEFRSSLRPSVLRPNAKFVEFLGGFLVLRDRLEAQGELNVTYNFDRLRQLPAMPTLYGKGRGGNSLHDDSLSYAAQEKTIQALGLIGLIFDKIDPRTISYNDISLPKGGIFDWDTDVPARAWRDTHVSHRQGTDVDINRPRDVNNVAERCDVNTTVQHAIDIVLTGIQNADGSNTALLCENRANKFPLDPGTYHLRVTNFKINPSFAAALKALQANPPSNP